MNIWLISPLEEHIQRVVSLQALINQIASDKLFDLTVFMGSSGSTLADNIKLLPNSVRVKVLPCKDKPGWSRALHALVVWRQIIKTACIECRPDLIIAVDKWGLFLSSMLWSSGYIAIWYLNFELRMRDEARKLSRKAVNSLEGYLHRRCNGTIIQDQFRAKAIAREHCLPSNHQFLFLPNAPAGIAFSNNSNYLRERFGIENHKTISLYVGSVTEHFMILELIEAFTKTCDGILVIHSPPSNYSSYRHLVREKIRTNAKKVILSEAFLKSEDLSNMIASADVGLGLFRPVRGNYVNELLMGFSSGKLAMYLHAGIPIITNRYPSVMWVEKGGCGKCIGSVTELRCAIDDISADRKRYSANAVSFFNKQLAAENYLPLIIHTMKNL